MRKLLPLLFIEAVMLLITQHAASYHVNPCGNRLYQRHGLL